MDEVLRTAAIHEDDNLVADDRAQQVERFRSQMTRQGIESNLGFNRVMDIGWVRSRVKALYIIPNSILFAASKRKTLEAQRWPLWYFSSQLKHRSHSWREAISSDDRRFRVGGGRGGSECGDSEGSRAGEGIGRGGDIVSTGGVRLQKVWRVSRSFSS